MHPILFTFGGIPIYTYGVLVATGVLLSLWYGRRQAPRAGIDPDKLWNLGIYFVLVALLMAKLWLILSAWDYYMANPREIFSVATFQSGGTFYGGVVGAVLTILLYTHFQKMPLLADTGHLRRRAAHRPRHRAPRMFCGWLLLRQTHHGGLGRRV